MRFFGTNLRFSAIGPKRFDVLAINSELWFFGESVQSKVRPNEAVYLG